SGPANAQARGGVRGDRGAAADPGRRPARAQRRRAPAGEAGGDRGALARRGPGRRHAAGAVRMAGRGSGAQRLRAGDPAPGRADPEARVGWPHPAADRGPRLGTAAGGAGVLRLPRHGRHRRADAAAHHRLAVGVAARHAGTRALAARRLALNERLGFRRAAGRLVRGRDRAPALRRVRPAAHQRGGQPEHRRRRGDDLARRLCLCVRGDLRCRHLVHPQADAGRAGAAAAQGHPGWRENARPADVAARRNRGRRGRPAMSPEPMGLEYLLPVLWFGVIGFGVLMYVLLDGFVLGLGILAPFAQDGAQLDHMMNTAAPIWDGNETWLVLGGAGLLAAFPAAYALVLSTLYLPVLLMLIALIFRGVAFECRFKATRARPFWGAAFSLGSTVAAFAQGVILGAIVQGIPLAHGAAPAGSFSWFSPFSMLTGIAVVFGYALLGASWLVLKTTGPL